VASLGKPWPGEVDDTGVRVYIDVNTISGSTVTLTSPSGTSWAITLTSTAAWYWDRETFTGETAGGKWTLSYTAAGGTLTSWKLIVSNDVDAGQIYNFYAYRDPDLDGDPDITEAQRLFRRTALAQMWSFVIESLDFACDDEHSLCDRDPLGD
jgi:hypothetical protein